MTALRKNDPARMFRPVDLSKPGALDELLSLHRLVFGGFRMEEPTAEEKAAAEKAASEKAAADKAAADQFSPITSQEDFDRRLSDRLARERGKFADYDDLKKKAEAHDAALEAAKTDAEKAVDAARKEGESTATTAANARIVKAEAKTLAAEAKFRNPALAIATIDLSDVKVADDGTVDEAAIKAKLTALATSDPYLVDDGKGGKPKPDKGQGGGGDGDKPSIQRGAEMFAARRGGKKAAS